MKGRVADWREEHLRFAKLLDMLESHLDSFHHAEQPNYQLMLEVMRYMSRYPDNCHHPREDLAFAKVAERRPNKRGDIEALHGEHEAIRKAGRKLVEMLEEVLDDAILARHEVEEPGREYIRHLRDHMRREEALFPAVAAVLRAEDWAAIDRELPRQADPLVAARGGERYAALRRVVSATTRKLVA